MITIVICIILCFSVQANAQNVGIGTLIPNHKLDVYGTLGLNGRLAISDLSDGWLRLNQAGNYSTGTIPQVLNGGEIIIAKLL